MKQSKFGRVNLRDAIHGFLMLVFAATINGIVQTLDAGQLPTIEQIKADAMIGLTAGLSYLIKNFLQNQNGEILKKDK
jgi:hypothetical protein